MQVNESTKVFKFKHARRQHVSSVLRLNAAATARPAAPRRVSFAFDEGYFQTENGLRLPYPVPFKLLGKEAEGWLDTEFLGDELRISTGNKGTTFVLRRGD